MRLHQGALAADVRPQPAGRALRIQTPDAEVLARDAKLAITASERQKTVVGASGEQGNSSGSVGLRRLSDGQSVSLPVRAGEWTVASVADGLEPRRLQRPPDKFLIRFGAQLPPGWEAGELVHNDLPPDSEAAVRAVATPNPRGGINHKISTQNAWTEGLFEIHDDSWIHVRFRVEKPGFFHILVVARDPDPTRRASVVLESPDIFSHRKAGQWYTVDLRFADFRPTDPNRPPLDKPLIAFLVVFDSQRVDRGVTVDTISVTRGDANLQ
jgi:hypothetical protein